MKSKHYILVRLYIVFALLCYAVASLADAQQGKQQSLIAPDFTFSEISGEEYTLSEKVSGKPALLYFWATWCPYCKKATPKIVELHNNYSDVIEVLGINVGIDDSVELTQAYIEEFDIKFPIMFDHDNSVSQSYNVFGTPVFVVISDQGKMLYRGHVYPEGIEQALQPTP
ncbi:TlpA family protein disulfide reductase [Glaciecola sp. 1036]|uniref:TlpA family protein disulfide reductase n=1 Tax=Alteromonadaceae TaxID=72275 RepID=UPI003D052266